MSWRMVTPAFRPQNTGREKRKPPDIVWSGSTGSLRKPGSASCSADLPGGDGLLRLFGLGGLRGGLERSRRLCAEAIREPIDAAFFVYQLLAAREERVAVVADFEVKLRLGWPGLP